jgi:signal transduction histidine kinase
MKLRTKLSLVLSILFVVSIGTTGAILIYESARHMRRSVEDRHLLIAENRAFALRDNFEILENELERLARLPQIDTEDNNPLPETELLDSAHGHSVLYNTAVLLLKPDGDCILSVPDSPNYRGQRYGDRAWFRTARANLRGPQFHPSDEPGLGRTLKIVQPIVRRGRFAGALVGVIALGQENLLTPALRENLPPLTEAVLVDLDGRILYPPDAWRAAPESGWARAIGRAIAAAGRTDGKQSGTLRARTHDEDSLFAYAAVGAGSRYAVVLRWPWSSLITELRHQAWVLGVIALFGIVLAATAGLALSAYLTKPLEALGETARRIGRGEYPRSGELPGKGASDELGALVRAIDHMGESVRERDRALGQAAAELERRVEERTRELAMAQQALVEAERFAAMGKTSAAIAHELKNSMGGLGMAVDLILQDPANAVRVARLRKQVVTEIARLRDVTDALLSFSRSPRVDRQPQELGLLIRNAVGLLGDVIADRNAEVRVETAGPLPVTCDGHKIQSVVMNLVKNAVEAGKTVVVRARTEDGQAIVEVADDGPGLSAEARSHLFEPFFTTKPNGTGLGLPTSQRFVEAHGGRIESATAPQGGALFRVMLPREARAA